MGVNKVEYGDETLIDLTGDSVTPETLAEGVTAHDASGEPIIGTMRALGDNDITSDVIEDSTKLITSGGVYTALGGKRLAFSEAAPTVDDRSVITFVFEE